MIWIVVGALTTPGAIHALLVRQASHLNETFLGVFRLGIAPPSSAYPRGEEAVCATQYWAEGYEAGTKNPQKKFGGRPPDDGYKGIYHELMSTAKRLKDEAARIRRDGVGALHPRQRVGKEGMKRTRWSTHRRCPLGALGRKTPAGQWKPPKSGRPCKI